VAGAEFLARYPEELTNLDYVNKLLQTSNLKLSQAEHARLVDSLNNREMTRAEVLINVIDHAPVTEREYKEAFVAMCYFIYLKREPDPAGYEYWLRTLINDSEGERTVIKGFIYSGEYRARFGQP
jgi:hypothetical protein